MAERLRLNVPISKVDANGRSHPLKENGSGKARGGRPKGSVNRLTYAQREAYAKTGEMPLDFLIRVYRTGYIHPIGRRRVEATPEQMMDAAKSAAPYLHPKLHPVTVTGEDAPIPFDLSKLSGLPPQEIEVANRVLGVLFGGQYARKPVLEMQQSEADPSLYEATLDE